MLDKRLRRFQIGAVLAGHRSHGIQGGQRRRCLEIVDDGQIFAEVGKDQDSESDPILFRRQVGVLRVPLALRHLDPRLHDVRAGDLTALFLPLRDIQELLRSKAAKVDPWLLALRGRRPRLVVAVALANKTARIAWAIMSKQDTYRRTTAAA